MSYCKNCREELHAGAQFCPQCGAPVMAAQGNEKVICPRCGRQNSPNASFCSDCGFDLQMQSPVVCPACGCPNNQHAVNCGYCNFTLSQFTAPQKNDCCPNCSAPVPAGSKSCAVCGTPIKNDSSLPLCKDEKITPTNIDDSNPLNNGQLEYPMMVQPSAMATVPKTTSQLALISNIRKIPVKFIVIGASVFVILILLLIFLFQMTKSKENDSIFYLKNDSIFGIKASSESKPTEITDYDLNNLIDLGGFFTLSKDGKTLYLPADYDDDEGSYTLYYYRIGGNSKRQKIDSNIIWYELVQEENKILYLTSSNVLYYSDMKEKKKLATNITEIVDLGFVDKKGESALCRTMENDFYFILLDGTGTKEIIGQKIASIKCTKNLQKIAYISGKDLFLWEKGKEKKKIDSNVLKLYYIKEDGTICYAKDQGGTISLSNYVEDDLAQQDAELKKPEMSDYKITATIFGYAYQTYDFEKYYQALYNYQKKESRDRLRQQLKEKNANFNLGNIYSYNGKQSTITAEQVVVEESYEVNEEVIAYQKASTEEIKLSISKISSINYLKDYIYKEITSNGKQFILIGTKESLLANEPVTNFYLFDHFLYYFEDFDAMSDRGTLKKAELKDGAIGNQQTVDEDVMSYLQYEKKIGLLYFKKASGQDRYSSDLYLNGELLISNASLGCYYIDDAMYILSDFGSDSVAYTLSRYQNGILKKISEDVTSFSVWNGKIAYLYDYNEESYSGDLMLYQEGKEPVKLDEKVFWLFQMNGIVQ